jgi:WD40-like Beta Propeller Repeat
MTMTEPPARRELTPVRHAQLRAGILRQAGERHRPGWTLPAAAAAVTALLVSGIAAVPALRRHDTTPAASAAGPHVLVAYYSDDQGRRVYDPESHTYVPLAGEQQLPFSSPDGRWTAVGVDTFNALRIAPPGQSGDPKVGRVEAKELLKYGSLTGGMLWSADSSRLYVSVLGSKGTRGRVLGIDPVRHRVVSTTDLGPLNAITTDVRRPKIVWRLVGADPRTGFLVFDDGLLISFSPTGRRLGQRRLIPPVGGRVPLVNPITPVVSPDGRRLAFGRPVGRKPVVGSVDLGTGREVDVDSPPGWPELWTDADHFVLYTQQRNTTSIAIVEADTGRIVRTGNLTGPGGATLGTAQLIPLVGPPPPGAITF